ncbi:GGDEF domain-containing protein [Ralstonia solanacearum]|uniref:sensor domain-containing diguanylate cyclase n=1 Tax=Ralstonia solanacearum TaxID=305 RepID=UPI0018D1000D|nr:diguanylate cyclase [Ralstonia solanacearum]MDB0568686.1 diguanylate cyclase [Ralstonia solanacearum]MDB0576822.1 diguanylate cyclase [Ralstonia solanacearum]
MSTVQPPSAPRRLLFRLLPGVVCAALLPFVGLIAVAVSTVYDDTRREIDSRLEQAIAQAARPLEAHLTDAIDRLSAAADDAAAPASSKEGQAWLDAHPELRGVFDNLLIVSATGVVLADAPALPQRRGDNMAQHPIFKTVRESHRLYIPEPSLTQDGQRPVASFAVPLHGPDGSFSGLVVGSIELTRNPILADVENTRIGRSGRLLVVSGQGRYLVGPDRTRLLQQAPDLAAGQPAARARAQGWNDSTEIHPPGQAPVIVSYRPLNAVPWSVGAWWPAQEAYAGAVRTTHTLVAAGIAFGAACLLFAWFWLERATGPLERLRHEVEAGMPIHTPPAPVGRPALSEPPAPGPIARLADLAHPDARTFDPATEVGALAGGVGRLVQYWERALGTAEQEAAFFRAIAEQAPVGLAFLDSSLTVPFANVRFERLVGTSSTTIVRALQDGDSTTTSPAAQAVAAVLRQLPRVPLALADRPVVIATGEGTSSGAVLLTARPAGGAGAPPVGWIIAVVDATAEQRAKEALEHEVRAALLVLDAIQEPLLTIDGDGIVTHASRAIETLTGTHPASAIGQSINRLLHLIEHETNRRVIPTQLLRAGGTLPGGLRLETANGRRQDVELSWGPLPGTSGAGVLVLRDVSATRETVQRIAWDATHDVLTGLLNRRGFDATLRAQVEAHRVPRGAPRTPLALLMIDLDGFKAINDCYGHAAGDDVLRGTAERVVQNTRTQDHAARLGGDEFAVILPNCDLQTAVTFADRIRAALARQPVLAAGARAQIALSQGVVELQADDADAAAFLARADAACYRAKSEGRNTIATG